jgi:hypothetical protein
MVVVTVLTIEACDSRKYVFILSNHFDGIVAWIYILHLSGDVSLWWSAFQMGYFHTLEMPVLEILN